MNCLFAAQCETGRFLVALQKELELKLSSQTQVKSAGGGDSSPPLLFLKLVQPQPPPAAVCEQGVPVRVCGRGCRGASRARRNCSFL